MKNIFISLAEKYGTTPEIVESLYYKYMDFEKVENELKRIFPSKQ